MTRDIRWKGRASRVSAEILIGDVRERLRDIPTASAHTIVTSPPYWGVRDNSGCDCVVDGRRDVWDNGRRGRSKAGGAVAFFRHGRADPDCRVCGGTGFIHRLSTKQIGGEADLNDYLESILRVMREARRVLRPEGTLWLNMGDCHAGEYGSMRNATWIRHVGDGVAEIPRLRRSKGREWGSLKSKDLVLLPARVALILQDEGWWLFSAIVWHKRSVAPGSALHRPTHAYEMIYYLSKSADPFYDWVEAREPAVSGGRRPGIGPKLAAARHRHEPNRVMAASGLRHLRDVWELPGRSNVIEHTSTFPPSLPERCIRIGTSAHGACSRCRAPYYRQVKKFHTKPRARRQPPQGSWNVSGKARRRGGINDGEFPEGVDYKTLGWTPSCDHDAPRVPCVVLDPFAGAGTTALAALMLGRSSISIELRQDHARTITRRLRIWMEQEAR